MDWEEFHLLTYLLTLLTLFLVWINRGKGTFVYLFLFFVFVFSPPRLSTTYSPLTVNNNRASHNLSFQNKSEIILCSFPLLSYFLFLQFSCFTISQKASISINSPLALSGGAPNAMCATSRSLWFLYPLSSSLLSFFFFFLLFLLSLPLS